MTSYGAYAQWIIVALLAVASIGPGLKLVQESLLDFVVQRKSAAIQACHVNVERERGTRTYTTSERINAQRKCQDDLFSEIQRAYNPGLFYICKTRQLVDLSAMFPNASSAAIEASAATSSAIEECRQYDNSASKATSTASGT